MEDRIPRWLQHYHETCCKKGGCCGRRACMITPQRCNFQMGGLAYDIVVLFTLLGILILFLCKRMSFTCEIVSG